MHTLRTCRKDCYLGVEEVVGVGFVDGRQTDVFGVITVDHSGAESNGEHSGVDVETSPACGLVEGAEVLGEVEQTVQKDHFVTVFGFVHREDGILAEHTQLVDVQEVEDGLLKK